MESDVFFNVYLKDSFGRFISNFCFWLFSNWMLIFKSYNYGGWVFRNMGI